MITPLQLRCHSTARSLRTGLILFVLCGALSAEVAELRIDKESVKESFSQLDAGEHEQALKGFREAMAESKDNLAARFGEAMALSALDRHKDAFASYDAIVNHHPDKGFAWNGRGLAAFNMADFDTALASFQKATSSDQAQGFFYESLAWTRMCRGEFKQAIEAAKRAAMLYNREGSSNIYPLLIVYFSQLEENNKVQAKKTLAYANSTQREEKWPSPVLSYLKGQIDASGLISHVSNFSQETEAHTYIGLHLRVSDDPKRAERHLQWAAKKGDDRVFEHTLAKSLNLRHQVAVSEG